MDAATGRALDGDAHLAQSLADILSTPIGTRVGLREYGSLLLELVDAPVNKATAILMRAATAIAIARWEPRLRLTRVEIGAGAVAAEPTITLEGERTDQPAPNAFTRLTLPLRIGRGAQSGAVA